MWEPSDRVWRHLVLVPVSSVSVSLMPVVCRYVTSRYALFLFCFAVCCFVCEGGGALEAREKPVVHPKVVPSGLGSCGWLAFRQGDRIGRKRVEALLHLVVVEDIFSGLTFGGLAGERGRTRRSVGGRKLGEARKGREGRKEGQGA